jgi:dTDP-4-dehydrorhamnose reductase
MLGQAVEAALKARHISYTGADLPECDITRPSDLRLWIGQAKPGILINCAAFTAVDDAETQREEAMAANREALLYLAEAARGLEAPLVHISTDYVFNGLKAGAWTEEDPPDPVNYYGLTKLEGEKPVLAYERGLVIRTSWLFGRGGKNFVNTIAGKLKAEEIVDVVDDQRGCPTSTPALAEAILNLLQISAKGVYHFCQLPETTWFGLARTIALELGVPETQVRSTTSDRFPRPAKRPVNSVLSTEKYRLATGHTIPFWTESLREHLKAAE